MSLHSERSSEVRYVACCVNVRLPSAIALYPRHFVTLRTGLQREYSFTFRRGDGGRVVVCQCTLHKSMCMNLLFMILTKRACFYERKPPTLTQNSAEGDYMSQ